MTAFKILIIPLILSPKKFMNREAKIRAAMDLIWRNLPSGPSTFGPCYRKCGREGFARDGGPCIHCAQDDLAKLTSSAVAKGYVAQVRGLRAMEAAMLKD